MVVVNKNPTSHLIGTVKKTSKNKAAITMHTSKAASVQAELSLR